jgi:hypothetical protein
MGSFDVEGAARSILEAGGYDWDETPGALRLAQALGVRVVWRDLKIAEAAAVDPLPSGIPTTIVLRQGLGAVRAAWLIAHDLAEIDLATVRYQGEDIERVAEALAAALLMPRPAFQRVAGTMNVHELAAAFAVPETAAALRLAEVGHVDAVAVVTPQTVHVRTDGQFVLPPARELRRIARIGAHPGLRKVQLRDQPQRVALVA